MTFLAAQTTSVHGLLRILGVLMALILAPTVAGRFYFVMAGPALIGEASLCLWLLLKGVNVEKWKAQAGAQPTGSAADTV